MKIPDSIVGDTARSGTEPVAGLGNLKVVAAGLVGEGLETACSSAWNNCWALTLFILRAGNRVSATSSGMMAFSGRPMAF
jgi:hypothetical protein